VLSGGCNNSRRPADFLLTVTTTGDKFRLGGDAVLSKYANETHEVIYHLARDMAAHGLTMADATAKAERVVRDPNLRTPAACARALGLPEAGYRNR
jgi:hypothetical protein